MNSIYGVLARNGIYFAAKQYAIAVSIYQDEWEALSPLVRPAVPVITPYRALQDGFISDTNYYWLTRELLHLDK